MPRNILIMTLGETVAVVTETVYSLLTRDPPWVPEEVHIVTHANGRALSRQVLAGKNGELSKLFKALGYKPIEPRTHVPKDSQGCEVADILTAADNVAFGNALTRLIKDFADQDDTRLHVSLSGGRKTMSSYAALAISLFGRDHDELTHVLVQPLEIQERVRNFYWPGQKQQQLIDRSGAAVTDEGGVPLVAHAANITLASMPFVRMRPLMREVPFPGGEVDYARIVALVQEAINVRSITLECSQCTVSVGPYRVKLGQGEFALYRLIATAAQQQWPGAGQGGLGTNHSGWLTYTQILDRNSVLQSLFSYFDDAYAVGVEKAEDIKTFILVQLAAAEHAKTPRERREAIAAITARLSQLKSRISSKIRKGIPSTTLRALAGI